MLRLASRKRGDTTRQFVWLGTGFHGQTMSSYSPSPHPAACASAGSLWPAHKHPHACWKPSPAGVRVRVLRGQVCHTPPAAATLPAPGPRGSSLLPLRTVAVRWHPGAEGPAVPARAGGCAAHGRSPAAALPPSQHLRFLPFKCLTGSLHRPECRVLPEHS